MARVPSPSLEPGTLIADSYRLGRLLGRGGMGEVFEAVHLDTGVAVAIKLLVASASQTIIERFEREGRALAQMRGEHVIKVFDVGVIASGRPFIVMELLAGSDLAVLKQQRGRLPANLVISYMQQACIGLAEAHGLGIVHRDIKPANLYRAELPSGRQVVKILDFGISKVNTAAKAGKTGLTEAGDVFGSPKYMSPEQLHATRDVDLRTDIWSIGVTMAELLTGTTPFEAEDFGTLVFNILAANPPSVAHADVENGAALDAILRRCLARDPDDRFSGVDALADALAPLIDGGVHQSQRVRETLRDATQRAQQLEGRAQPQVTRVIPAASENRTTAVVRITIAPITIAPITIAQGAVTANEPAATVPQATVPQATVRGEPGRRRRWMLMALSAIVVLITGTLFLAWTSATDAGDPRADRGSPPKRKRKGTKRKRGGDAPAPESKSDRRTLSPELAARLAFEIAPEIGGLLREAQLPPIEVRDLLFFRDRAVLLVVEGRDLVRYDYRDGELSDAKPSRVTSGARRSERLALKRLDLEIILRMVERAKQRFGVGKLHSIGLQWLKTDVVWVCASVDGDSVRYALDGQTIAQ